VQTVSDDAGLRHGPTWHAPSKRGLVAWCSLVLVLRVCIGHATMRQLPLEDLARKADTVILGTVTHQESAWDAQHTAIYTDVTLVVERVLAGAPTEVVTLRVLGGSVGIIGMRTSNDAVFRQGEQVIVFLDTSAAPSTVVGMQQGKFTVKDSTVTRADETWSLDEFSAAVRAAAR
jgi:hypothetical protein